jgi:hypothetical protein
VPAAGVQGIAHAPDRQGAGAGQARDAIAQLLPRLARIVDAGSGRHELARSAQLGDDLRRDAQTTGHPLHGRRLGSRGAEAVEQPIDAGAHLRVEGRFDPRKADSSAVFHDATVLSHRVEDREHGPIIEQQPFRAAMARRAPGRHVPCRPEHDIGPEVGAKRLAPVKATQGAQQPPLGQAALAFFR